MSALDNIIDSINASPEKGTLFEKLCLYFLRHDPTQQSQFSDVWPWHDWPGNNNERDTGIDIVARLRDSDSYCAVQCKFRQDDSSITKAEIDSFLAKSSTTDFSARIIFTLTGNFSDNAQNALKGQSTEVRVFTRQTLEDTNIDWSVFTFDDPAKIRHTVKSLRPHQIRAVNDVLRGLAHHDRGKLIMACGTGKTFTSLKIAERFAGKGGSVLVLVPSISLLNQTVLAWNYDHDANLPLISLPVCSDSTAGYDNEDMKAQELTFKPTTDPEKLYTQYHNNTHKSESLTVIFSTYQSLQVIHDAQQKGFPRFDLVICDEAHRTAGVTLEGNEDSYFRAIHDDSFIQARKRLYMTATPKIFGETPAKKAAIQKKARENNAVLFSMDDEKIYGPEFHRLSFSQAVKGGLLTDYKVMIFMVKSGGSKDLDDKALVEGICKALAKNISRDDFDFIQSDPQPMKRAVNFTGTIKQSERFKAEFPRTEDLTFSASHVDGTQPSTKRNKAISWLKQESSPAECRILSNARCLSEGVDVPALDAVIFFSPKRSEIDIVQSVGRVMRNAPGKTFGYVILPVVIQSDEIPETALDKNESYRSVWKVLQALRAHDDHFDAVVNSIDLNQKSEKLRATHADDDGITHDIALQWRQEIYIRIVRKCGDREYWDKWVSDLATVAEGHSRALESALKIPGAQKAFNEFADDLRSTVNPSISNSEAVAMLAQHIVSKRVFDELFTEFSSNNPISRALQRIINTLDSFGFKADDSQLEKFYEHVHEAVKEAKTDLAKQELIRRIYDHFFRKAFPKMAQKLGIVYTPVEIVDFILKSSDWAARKLLNLDGGLSSPHVHILDPFSGTGTFTVRLIQSGIIPRGRLSWKYKHGEIHANEILLLPYYISAVNIESAFTQINDGEYESFPGMVLADTFMLNTSETPPMHPILYENGERAHDEEKSAVNVIIGNPPYSVGQKSANDNNQNTYYPNLRGLVKSSYADKSTATNKNSLYDSYILAIKWASERLKGPRGIVCFVTNGSFIDSNSADGMRKCLAEDFAYIFIFNLRGNANTSGDLRRKEGDGIFGEGSRTPAAITMLIKDESRKGLPCEIRYYECGDRMKRAEKLAELVRLGDFGRMIEAGVMREIKPNDYGDWVMLRDDGYDDFVNLGNKKEDRPAIFDERYSRGVATGRDAWCYNFSREALCANMAGMIEVYNSERERWSEYHGEMRLEDFVTNDPAKISWDSNLFRHFRSDSPGKFLNEAVRVSLYRPYVKEYAYFSGIFNNSVHKMFSIFPAPDTENLVICVPGIGSKKDFSVLMMNCLPELQVIMNGQCFPLYWYYYSVYAYGSGENEMFEMRQERHDGISDSALSDFRARYNDDTITKEDMFYYIYGVLSSLEYAMRFGNEARRVLARVPYVKDAETFRAFVEAGRKLGALHVNYESADEYPVEVCGDDSDLRVVRMKIADDNGERVIRYNAGITLRGIPSKAWEYRVNGRSALEWIVERYKDDTDKASGIRNDCNAWGEADYVLRLIRRVVGVSVETVRILEGLPGLGV